MAVDPVELVEAALEQCPTDPTAATEEHLVLLAAAAEGIARHAIDLRARQGEFAIEVVTGAVSLSDALEQSNALAAERSRSDQAEQQIRTYFTAATSARGHARSTAERASQSTEEVNR